MILNNNPSIILVAPQLGENIGAVARAMKNFGLQELRIVSPRDGWPNLKANAAAVHAADLIEKAKIYDNLITAISDIEYLYATTGQVRQMNKNYVLTKQLTQEFPFSQRVGILFGRENCGLTNEEINLANKIIAIDTNPEFASLNIAQAVLVICYELFQPLKRPEFANVQALATKEELNYFYDDLFTKLEQKNFFKVLEKQKQMQINIANIFSRIHNLSKSEIQTLRGIINCLSFEAKNK